MQLTTQQRKTAFVIAIILVILVAWGIGYYIFTSIDRVGKIAVTVSVVPQDASVSIGGVAVPSKGTVYLKEGEYTITATRDGFTNFSQSARIDASNKVLTIGLTPQTDQARKWVANNQQAYRNNEGLAGEASAESGEQFRDLNPITNELPFKNLLFTIGYRADPSDPSGNSIIIEIDAPPGYRQSALYQIQQLGFDPTEYKINFSDYTDPFAS